MFQEKDGRSLKPGFFFTKGLTEDCLKKRCDHKVECIIFFGFVLFLCKICYHSDAQVVFELMILLPQPPDIVWILSDYVKVFWQMCVPMSEIP